MKELHPNDGVIDAVDLDDDDDGVPDILDCAPLDQDETPCLPPIPPDPSTVAPLLDQTVPARSFDVGRFLIEGASPIQTGVAFQDVAEERAAVVSGHVRGRGGAPLAGALISILRHPEFGQTVTRSDGRFDILVNGGGELTVIIERFGYLEVQRSLRVDWRSFNTVPDVVLTRLDSAVTRFAPAKQTTPVVHVASEVTDDDGTRRARLLVFPGTEFVARGADCGATALSAVSLRATEYTVGPKGPAAMPAVLPAEIAYTYCAEISIDEAEAIGADGVELNQPVIMLIENYRGFDVGALIPLGYYDRALGKWIPEQDAVVLRLLSVADGLVDVDVDDDGVGDGAALGITTSEREALVGLFDVGDTFTRAAVTHLTPMDTNTSMLIEPVPPTLPPEPEFSAEDNDCRAQSSIIHLQSQVLEEAIPISGTQHLLHYRSDRLMGYAAPRAVRVPLASDTKRVAFQVWGQSDVRTFSAASPPPDFLEFLWDGGDLAGRPTMGSAQATVTVTRDIEFRRRYYRTAQCEGGVFLWGFSDLSKCRPPAQRTDTVLSEREVTFAVRLPGVPTDPRVLGVGGLTFGVHHTNDADGRTLSMGDGSVRRQTPALASEIVRQISPVTLVSVALLPDGRLVGSRVDQSGSDHDVVTIDPRSGELTTIVPGDPTGVAGVMLPQGVAVDAAGAVYIADAIHGTVKRLDESGLHVFVGGGDDCGYERPQCDGTQTGESVRLAFPTALAIGPDGALYVADKDGNQVHQVQIASAGECSPSQTRVATVVGSGTAGLSESGTRAVDGSLQSPEALAVLSDGTLAVAANDCVQLIGVDGVLRHATSCDTGGGFDVNAVAPNNSQAPVAIAASRTPGAAFVLDRGSAELYELTAPFESTVRIGSADGAPVSNSLVTAERPALRSQLGFPAGVAVGHDDRIFVADALQGLLVLTRPRAAFSDTDVVVPDQDGRTLFVFDKQGRHLRTVDDASGAIQWTFTYDDRGRLVSIGDRDGLVTTIEQGQGGIAEAIVSPYGERTLLAMNPDGYLEELVNADGGTARLEYVGDGGLLASFIDENGHASRYTYDELGRLIASEDAAGSVQTLTRERLGAKAYRVTHTSGEGRATIYTVDKANGDGRQNQFPSGVFASGQAGPDAINTIARSDGSTVETVLEPDQRHGMASPQSAVTTTRPSGLARTVSSSHVVTTNPGSGLVAIDTRTTLVNGRVFEVRHDASARTMTSISPFGRQSVTTMDAFDRPIRVDMGGFAPVATTYDDVGRPTRVVAGDGIDARETRYEYGLDGRLERLIDAADRETAFVRDGIGRVTQLVLPGGRAVDAVHDDVGNLIALTPPGRLPHIFTFTPVNLPETSRAPVLGASPATPTTATNTYNLDRQLVQHARPSGEAITLGRDGAGRLVTTTFSAGEIVHDYNPVTGQLAGIAGPDGIGVAYAYDGPLVTDTIWSGPISGTLSHTFDSDFRVVEEDVNTAGNIIQRGYDSDGLLIEVGPLILDRAAAHPGVIGSGVGLVEHEVLLDAFGAPSSVSWSVAGGAFLTFSYTRDKLGRLIRVVEDRGGTTATVTYTYDDAGRLSAVGNGVLTKASYQFDDNGNRLQATRDSLVEASVVDEQDRLLTRGDFVYSYDIDGNLATKTNTATGDVVSTFYDSLGGLRRVLLPDGRVIDYVIDPMGRRIGKKIDGVLQQGFIYDGMLRVAAELDGQGAVQKRFLYATHTNVPDVVIDVTASRTYRVIHDHLGSPRMVVDIDDGSILAEREFDEFGRVIIDTAPGFLPFGFAGGLEDVDTGLARFGARDYETASGRWVSKDPIGFSGGATNLYEYADNDPVNFVDPEGRFATAAEVAVVGAVAVVALAALATTLASNPNTQHQEAAALAAAMASITDSLGRLKEWVRDRVRPFPPMGPKEVCELVPKGQEEPGNETVEIGPDEICDGDSGATACVYRCPSGLTFQVIELGRGCPTTAVSPWGGLL